MKKNVGKEENARNLHFFFLTYCFNIHERQKSSFELHLICHLQILSSWCRGKESMSAKNTEFFENKKFTALTFFLKETTKSETSKSSFLYATLKVQISLAQALCQHNKGSKVSNIEISLLPIHSGITLHKDEKEKPEIVFLILKR